jgi:hypothetical protein
MGKKTRMIQFGSIFFIIWGIKEFTDLIVNTFFMIKFGYIISLVLSILIYLLLGVFVIKINNSYGTFIEWFEYLKNLKDNNAEIKKIKIIRFIMRVIGSNKFLLAVLLYLKNPGLLIIYFRNSNGSLKKYIKLFVILYLISANVVWNIIVYYGVSVSKIVWIFIKGLF